jgi:hypothetical protein
MRNLFIALWLTTSACTSDPAQELRDACAAHDCPDDPPKYISCMPFVLPQWQPICAKECRDFLANTCKIQFVD